jgi:hypothetical protein
MPTGGVSVVPLMLIELNEVNFDFVRRYIDQGALPNFRKVIDQFGVRETKSEQKYADLEPWIQWVTAHTGKSFAEHRVFRLGDIVHSNITQIWEYLETRGCKVGAISPINAANRLSDSALFVPDPWTLTKVSGRPILFRLHTAVVQAVNDNAQKRLTVRTIFDLLAGFAVYAAPKNYLEYCRLALNSLRRPWFRAMFLDLFLSDVFMKEYERAQLDFGSLFLNAGAHIQHHYLFSSAVYTGSQRNPSWYVSDDDDPVLDVYKLYDRILGRLLEFLPNKRLLLATGLHQEPHEELTYYWRLRSHNSFLKKIGVPFARVEQLMSRDFRIVCNSQEQAVDAAIRLEQCKAPDGLELFQVDNRGSDLFVMLTYPREITNEFAITIGNDRYDNFRLEVEFVAIKNGEHDGTGYFVDTGAKSNNNREPFELALLPSLVARALGKTWATPIDQRSN